LLRISPCAGPGRVGKSAGALSGAFAARQSRKGRCRGNHGSPIFENATPQEQPRSGISVQRVTTMKKLLLSTTALILAMAIGPALAQEEIVVGTDVDAGTLDARLT